MIFILYLIVFLSILAYRRYFLTGAFLKESYALDKQASYLEAKTGHNRGSFTQHYGVTLNRRLFFSITPERWYHRFLKFTGLAVEIQTGYGELDDKLFFVSDAPEHFTRLLANEGQRKAIITLFQTYQLKGLRAFGDKLWLSCEGVNEQPESHRNDRLAILHDMSEDIDALPPAWDSDLSVKSFGFPHFAMLFMACHAALLGIGLAGWLPLVFEDAQIVNWQRMILICAIVLPLLPLFWITLIYRIMGRDGWTSLVIVDFLLVGLVGLGLSGFLLMREANIRFDTGAAEIKMQNLISKSCSLTCSRRSGKRRNSTTYPLSEQMCRADNRAASLSSYEQKDYKCRSSASFNYSLHLTPWADYQGHKDFNVNTSSGTYDSARAGDIFRVPVYGGAFGANWVDTEEIVKAGQ